MSVSRLPSSERWHLPWVRLSSRRAARVRTISRGYRRPQSARPRLRPASTDSRLAATTTTIPNELPPGVTFREPDGSYPSGLPNDPTFFGLGVWLETVTDEAAVGLDRSFGLNLYVALAHDDPARIDAIEASGLHLLVQADEWSGDQRADHPALDGWMVFDEADGLDPAGTIGAEPTGGTPTDRYRMKAASVATSCGTSMIGCPMARCATPTTGRPPSLRVGRGGRGVHQHRLPGCVSVKGLVIKRLVRVAEQEAPDMEHVAMARPCCWGCRRCPVPTTRTAPSPGGVAADLRQPHDELQRPPPTEGDRLSSVGDDINRSEHPLHERHDGGGEAHGIADALTSVVSGSFPCAGASPILGVGSRTAGSGSTSPAQEHAVRGRRHAPARQRGRGGRACGGNRSTASHSSATASPASISTGVTACREIHPERGPGACRGCAAGCASDAHDHRERRADGTPRRA
jgi:hypothetical protein